MEEMKPASVALAPVEPESESGTNSWTGGRAQTTHRPNAQEKYLCKH
jgi:hypothetical protein